MIIQKGSRDVNLSKWKNLSFSLEDIILSRIARSISLNIQEQKPHAPMFFIVFVFILFYFIIINFFNFFFLGQGEATVRHIFIQYKFYTITHFPALKFKIVLHTVFLFVIFT